MNKSFERSFAVLALGLCLCLVALLTGSPVSAQSTFGSLSGTVTDSSGSAIPDAQVVLTSLATGASQTLTTGGDGLYTFVNLNPGDYRLEVQKDGFKHYRREPVTIQVQQSFRIDPALEVGAVTQTVEVTGETPLLTPTSSTLGQVIDERATNEIPLNGRNVFNLITLSPGAIAQGGAGGTPVGQNPFSWGNYQVAGSFGNQSAEYLDGQPLNIGYINLPIIIPTQDSIAEFKVQYNNLGAEWGKFSGGIVNFSTKGGSNDYHGEAYEYLRNKVLNASPYNFGALSGGTLSPDPTPGQILRTYRTSTAQTLVDTSSRTRPSSSSAGNNSASVRVAIHWYLDDSNSGRVDWRFLSAMPRHYADHHLPSGGDCRGHGYPALRSVHCNGCRRTPALSRQPNSDCRT